MTSADSAPPGWRDKAPSSELINSIFWIFLVACVLTCRLRTAIADQDATAMIENNISSPPVPPPRKESLFHRYLCKKEKVCFCLPRAFFGRWHCDFFDFFLLSYRWLLCLFEPWTLLWCWLHKFLMRVYIGIFDLWTETNFWHLPCDFLLCVRFLGVAKIVVVLRNIVVLFEPWTLLWCWLHKFLMRFYIEIFDLWTETDSWHLPCDFLLCVRFLGVAKIVVVLRNIVVLFEPWTLLWCWLHKFLMCVYIEILDLWTETDSWHLPCDFLLCVRFLGVAKFVVVLAINDINSTGVVETVVFFRGSFRCDFGVSCFCSRCSVL